MHNTQQQQITISSNYKSISVDTSLLHVSKTLDRSKLNWSKEWAFYLLATHTLKRLDRQVVRHDNCANIWEIRLLSASDDDNSRRFLIAVTWTLETLYHNYGASPLPWRPSSTTQLMLSLSLIYLLVGWSLQRNCHLIMIMNSVSCLDSYQNCCISRWLAFCYSYQNSILIPFALNRATNIFEIIWFSFALMFEKNSLCASSRFIHFTMSSHFVQT